MYLAIQGLGHLHKVKGDQEKVRVERDSRLLVNDVGHMARAALGREAPALWQTGLCTAHVW